MVDRIEDLRDEAGHLDRAALLRALPYGDAFLLLDRVTELTDDSVTAEWDVPASAPWLAAHFTDLPIVPGVLVGESLAQAGTLLVRHRLADHGTKHVVGFQIDRALFSAPVLPGDTVRLTVVLTALRSSAARFEGKASVGDRKVCRAKLVVGIVDRAAFRAQVDGLREA